MTILTEEITEKAARAAAAYADDLPATSQDAYIIRSHRLGFASACLTAVLPEVIEKCCDAALNTGEDHPIVRTIILEGVRRIRSLAHSIKEGE